MLNVEITELLKYLKDIAANEKADDAVWKKFCSDPDFIELDRLIRRILSNEKKHFEVIFDLFPEPTIITTMEEGKLVAYNQAFLKIIETRGKATIDETASIHDLYFELDKREQLIADLKRTGISENMEIRVTDIKSETFVGLVSAHAIDIGGEPHILSVIRDITEIKRLEE